MFRKLILAVFIAIIAVWLIGGRDSGAGWEKVGGQGKMQFVLVDKATERDEATYRAAIESLCSSGAWCGTHFWADRALVPPGLPMSEMSARAQTASYTSNPNTGLRQFLWACRIKNDPNACFSE